MQNPAIPIEYKSVEQHIREAQLERAAVLGHIFADAVVAAGAALRAFAQLAGTVLQSIAYARHARSVEADALLGRTIVR